MNRKPQDETEQIEEEADYVNAAVCTVDKKEATSGQKFLSFTQSFLPMAACWVILLVIMSLHIYFTSVISENNAKLTAENQNLETQNQNLETQNQNLQTQNQNLTTQNQNLETQNQNLKTQNQNLETQNQNLETQNQNLTTQNQNLETQNQNLTTQNQNLKAQNQELETQKNLTEKIQDMETKQNELNVSRAQWSINAYCPLKSGGSERQCKPCQKGWENFTSGCYAFNNPGPAGQKPWDEAREDCKGKSSDLVVITDEQEKTFIHGKWWLSSGKNGFWIGLRVEDGKWKWVDGNDLTEESWIERPTEGHCATVVQNSELSSVNCSEKRQWICEQKALTV
ncbi:C-type lectin domain family 10 member A-like isoform X11 [Dicentrarchus labrax]|uniref:C-type lectin domain family 10 member A-like isoform X6 n=1 Tax=Dicentrarchus labrax TaxID=13489 RepID=UPI0021F562C2|nr:C-type lectin domain family 10 member A-like isoform X6 [Dicentrarchus labrax]XP_051249977.1 C-type lectin domain family 10 member A-like isoform X11 [Dicentrarchus labrax]